MWTHEAVKWWDLVSILFFFANCIFMWKKNVHKEWIIWFNPPNRSLPRLCLQLTPPPQDGSKAEHKSQTPSCVATNGTNFLANFKCYVSMFPPRNFTVNNFIYSLKINITSWPSDLVIGSGVLVSIMVKKQQKRQGLLFFFDLFAFLFKCVAYK